MTTSDTVILCLPREACSAVIGSLWATANGITGPERADLLSTAAQVHVDLCRTLGVDPLATRDMLFALPRELRHEYAEQLTRQARLRAP
jgi:hypothetical protein